MLAFRKALGILVNLIALAGLLVTGVLTSRRIDQRPRTDDAYLQADLVHMAPDGSGRHRARAQSAACPANPWLCPAFPQHSMG
jgi:hypothetical protein